MTDFKRLWQETEDLVHACEKQIAHQSIAFLRTVLSMIGQMITQNRLETKPQLEAMRKRLNQKD